MRRTPRSLVTAAAAAATVVGSLLLAPPVTARTSFPDVISLPDGFQPEGITSGRGNTFFVGSLVDGAIYRGNVRTGRGRVFIPGSEGNVAVGTEFDRHRRLWVAGGDTGKARVYNTRNGNLRRTYDLAPAGTTFVNDVVVTRKAAYFTDSVNPRLYVVPIRADGRLCPARRLSFSGELVYQTGFNVNGIEASPNGRRLLVVQSNTGNLYRVNAMTGRTRQVDLRGASLSNGDGLLRDGRMLYVVRNRLNQIDVVDLGRFYRAGRVVDTLTDSDFIVPTTVARIGSALYAVNARFGSPEVPTPDTAYTVVRVRAGR
jgi:sugar lactone lactonase YvrE